MRHIAAAAADASVLLLFLHVFVYILYVLLSLSLPLVLLGTATAAAVAVNFFLDALLHMLYTLNRAYIMNSYTVLVLVLLAVWNMPFYFVSISIQTKTQTQYTKRHTTIFIILNKFSNRVSEQASGTHRYWSEPLVLNDKGTYDHRFDDVSIVCLLQNYIHWITFLNITLQAYYLHDEYTQIGSKSTLNNYIAQAAVSSAQVTV